MGSREILVRPPTMEPEPLTLLRNSNEGRGILTTSNSLNPMARQIPLESTGNKNPLAPPPAAPNTPPSSTAATPRLQKTVARPAANASVGYAVFPSSRSPAACDMYDNVSGSRPHTHGDRLVKSPAAYSNGRLASRLPGSLPLRLRLAKCEATFCVWYKMPSRPGVVVMPRDDGVVAFALLLCLCQCWRPFC